MTFTLVLAATLPAPLTTVRAAEPDTTPATVDALETITISARKRTETLLEAPMSIAVLTGVDLEQRGVTNLQDLVRFAPGLEYKQMAVGIPGRANTVVQFRGMYTNGTDPTQQVAAQFLDGVYVPDGGGALSLSDIERVEVIRGPQSAVFGRSTFGGAVNYITRTPADALRGDIAVSGTDDSQYDVNAALEGSIAGRALRGRVSVRWYDKQGQYVASDGGRLGDESTKTIAATLAGDLGEAFSYRFRASYSSDEDGQPAVGFFSGFEQGQLCTPTATRKYICGEVPAVGPGRIDANTVLVPSVARTLDPSLSPEVARAPRLAHAGLARNSVFSSLNLSYDSPVGRFQSITGYTDTKLITLQDFDATGRNNWWSSNTAFHKVWSEELRFSSPENQRFSWSFGGSYFSEDFDDGRSPPNFIYVPINLSAGTDSFVSRKIRTKAVFGSMSYGVTDNLTASLEARYQDDSNDSFYRPSNRTFSGDWNSFLPRVILRYLPVDGTNLYATIGKGNKPGALVPAVITASPDVKRQIAAVFGDVTASGIVNEEDLWNYEIGFKRRSQNGRFSANVAAYYMRWTNQKNDVQASVYDPANSNLPTGMRSLTVTSTAGKSALYGLEFEGSAVLTDAIRMDLTVNYAGSKYLFFEPAGFGSDICGCNSLTDNVSPNFPKWSGSWSTEYRAAAFKGWSPYARLDVLYRGEAFVNTDNVNWSPAYTLANLRAGVRSGGLTLELFVNNLFDDDTVLAAQRYTDFNRAFNFAERGVRVMPALKRQVGARLRYDF